MGGGIGVLILVVLSLAGGISVMLLKLNARWKAPGQILLEARANVLGVTLLALLGLAGMSIAAFVIAELL